MGIRRLAVTILGPALQYLVELSRRTASVTTELVAHRQRFQAICFLTCILKAAYMPIPGASVDLLGLNTYFPHHEEAIRFFYGQPWNDLDPAIAWTHPDKFMEAHRQESPVPVLYLQQRAWFWVGVFFFQRGRHTRGDSLSPLGPPSLGF